MAPIHVFSSSGSLVLRVISLSSLITAALPALAGTQVVLPQLAFGGGWSTSCYVFNTTGVRVTIPVYFYGDDGGALAVPVNSGQPQSSILLTLDARGAAAIHAPNLGELKQGYAMLDLPAGVHTYGVFRQTVPGAAAQEAVVPLVPVGLPSASLAFDNTNFVTAIALANTGGSTVSVNVLARRFDGSLIGISLLTLEPRSKLARVLADLPGLENTRGEQGTVDFVSASPSSIALLGLRFLGTAFTSIPAFHGSLFGTQPPAAIVAPLLRASHVSSSEVRLSWTSSAPDPVSFVLERRAPGTDSFRLLARLGPAVSEYSDVNVIPGSTYSYRIRVETPNGSSLFSPEVSALLPNAITLAAPGNLTARLTSASTALLAWTNNAPDATAIRVELKAGSSGAFIDIGPAPSLNSSSVINLQPLMAYTFRVRAQKGEFYSAYSNEASITTPEPPTTVFLIHGLREDPSSMKSLAGNLTNPIFGLDPLRYVVDAGFDFSDCADNPLCGPQCTIRQGAERLADYVSRRSQRGKLALVGFSLGGLLAREAIRLGRIDRARLEALVTLGSPNLGYPYSSIDSSFACPYLAEAMIGDFRKSPGFIVMSDFLTSLTSQWPTLDYPGSSSQWMTAAGRACDEPYRSLLSNAGCPNENPYNDGVVCEASASYRVSAAPFSLPSTRWDDRERAYAHTDSPVGWLMCDIQGPLSRYQLLRNPAPAGSLFVTLRSVLSSIH